METRMLTVKTKASAYPPKWLMIIEEKFNLVRAHSVANRCVLSETSCFLYQILSHHIWVVKEQTKKQQEKKKKKQIPRIQIERPHLHHYCAIASPVDIPILLSLSPWTKINDSACHESPTVEWYSNPQRRSDRKVQSKKHDSQNLSKIT